ncbi:pyridoxal phosphate-dependent aminotransferase [Gottschalkiaceae bacterium SANA]|nr:pyridoxal phosphate-dependent aminotransferase [Gottschalkiaceae bacterium SANA]
MMISRRAKNMEPSMTAVVKSKVADYKSRGVDIISMNVGESDFNTPENIKDAGIAAIQANHTRYTPTAGLNQLKEGIAKKLLKENKAVYDKGEICVTTGAKLAVYNTIFAMCDEQDEVIIPTPCYVSYVDMVKLADAKPVLVETDITNGFQLDVAKLEAAVTDRTKVILINNPNNPTGAVYSRESLEALAELAVRKNLYIVSDDVYERFVYDGAEYVCIASLNEEIKKRTVVINGFSKGFNMTGWRIGYAAGPKKIIKTITSLQGHMTSNTNTISQWAACEALVGERETIENMVNEFQNRRDTVYEKLVQLEGVTCQKPEGAFYLFPDVSSYYGKKYESYHINNSNDMVEFLIDFAHVSLIPGSAFRSPSNIRIAYSNSQEMLNEGMDRIEKALKLLK